MQDTIVWPDYYKKCMKYRPFFTHELDASRKSLKKVSLLENNLNCKHVYHLFVVKSNNREKLMDHLNENDIQTFIHYPRPVNREDAFSEFNYY